MADNSLIEWTDATWNPITGCSVHSPGCTNCYAMRNAGTRLRHLPSRAGLTRPSKAGPVWTGEVRFDESALMQPLRWKRPRSIFVCAHGDLFHDKVPDDWIDRVFAVMALCPQHTFQVLTKRSARMREWFDGVADRTSDRVQSVMSAVERLGGSQPFLSDKWPLANVHLGVSVEDQQRADERIPDLLATPAAVCFISAEPLLGALDLSKFLLCPNARNGLSMDWETGAYECCSQCDYTSLLGEIGWVIVGGESGPGARPMHPDWARSLRDQCVAVGVPFFFKQWGEWAPVCAMDDDQVSEEHLYHPRLPRHRPEGPRRCKVAQLVVQAGGRVFPVNEWSAVLGKAPEVGDFAYAAGAGAMLFMAIGKKRAGRLLDGRTWDEMPA